MMQPKIGLVTVLYNSDGVLEGFLKSISSQNYDSFNLYIVDNSVNEDSTKYLRNLLEQFQLTNKSIYLPSASNYGVAKGNNVGIKQAIADDCEYIILLNNDIEFENNDLFTKLIEASVKNNKPIVSTKIHYYGTNRIWYAGCTFNKFRVYVNHIGYKDIDQGQYDAEAFFDSGPTCFIMFHKTVFDDIGFMDEKYFVYMDDIDFLYRCDLKGIKNFYYPSLLIQHKENYSTGGNNSEFSYFYIFRNRIYFILKFYNGILKYSSLLYLITAYFIKSIRYRRLKLFISGIKDGFALNK